MNIIKDIIGFVAEFVLLAVVTTSLMALWLYVTPYFMSAECESARIEFESYNN